MTIVETAGSVGAKKIQVTLHFLTMLLINGKPLFPIPVIKQVLPIVAMTTKLLHQRT